MVKREIVVCQLLCRGVVNKSTDTETSHADLAAFLAALGLAAALGFVALGALGLAAAFALGAFALAGDLAGDLAAGLAANGNENNKDTIRLKHVITKV